MEMLALHRKSLINMYTLRYKQIANGWPMRLWIGKWHYINIACSRSCDRSGGCSTAKQSTSGRNICIRADRRSECKGCWRRDCRPRRIRCKQPWSEGLSIGSLLLLPGSPYRRHRRRHPWRRRRHRARRPHGSARWRWKIGKEWRTPRRCHEPRRRKRHARRRKHARRRRYQP